MGYNKPKLTKEEVSQEFNLRELFKVDFDLPNDLVQNFAQDAIDKIIERTEKGKAIHGRNLKRPYSKAYKNSDEYKDFGKTGKVNMTLTGRMLDDIDIISEDGNSFKIGFEDRTETEKSFNHNTGDTVPKRPFFGLTKKETQELVRSYKDEINELKREFEESEEVQDRRSVADLLDDLNILLANDGFFDA